MKKLNEVLKNKENGLYYGNRILMPFKVDILKAVVENDIIMDFSSSDRAAEYNKNDRFTEVYFHDYKDLSESISEYETIKLIVVEEELDIFDPSNHKKLILHLKENHVLQIEEAGEDSIFIE